MKRIKQIKKHFKEWNPSIYATILLLIIPFMFFSFGRFKLDNDFYFLINTGKYILHHGFVHIEPFTIHEGLFFVPQQWLSAIMFYLIYSNLGIVGIFIFVIMANIFIVFLLYKLAYLISRKRSVSILLTILVDIILILASFITTRPQLFDIMIFLTELIALETYVIKKNQKALYIILLLSVLLINLHAALWPMLFVMLLPYYAEYIIRKVQKRKTFELKPLLIVTLLSLFCGLINPYHIHAVEYFFRSYGLLGINSYIGEMEIINIKSNLIIFVFIFIALLCIYKNKGNNKIRYICLFLGTLYLTLSHFRGLLFLTVIFLVIGSDAFQGNKKENKPDRISNKEKNLYVLLIILFIGIIGLNIKLDDNNNLKPIGDYLDKHASKNVKLYTGYDDGGYLEYRGYKCYIDPRAELFFKSNNKKVDVFVEYIKVMSGKINLSEFLKKYDFDYLVVWDEDYFLKKELDNNKKYKMLLKTEGVLNNNKKRVYYLYRRGNGKSD